MDVVPSAARRLAAMAAGFLAALGMTMLGVLRSK
jgi:hypothetical protein